jgi:hypothetical protein
MVKVVNVIPIENYRLKILLSNGKEGVFDVNPYLDKGVFQELRDMNYFNSVKAAFGGVVWPNEQDFSADTIEFELQMGTASHLLQKSA